MSAEARLKREMVRVCRRLHRRQLIAATDGNVSVRLGDMLLTTPSGLNKGFMDEDQIITVDLEGRLIKGQGRPTSELRLHLLAYQVRPEIRAVVHAHPPLATACSLAGVSLEEPVLPEVVMTLKKIPTAAYATPTTADVPGVLEECLKDHDAAVLARHGAITLGADLMDAYNKMEKLEHTALVVFAARLLGGYTPLAQEEVAKLLRLGGKAD